MAACIYPSRPSRRTRRKTEQSTKAGARPSSREQLELAMADSTDLHQTLGAPTRPTPHQHSFDALPPVPSFQAPYANSVLAHPASNKLFGQSIETQINYILSDRSQFLGEHPNKRIMADRCARVVACYSELEALGFSIKDVTVFGLRHSKSLLTSWRAKGLSPKTIYNRWSTLRAWSLVLNKFGMLGPLEELWPQFSHASPDSQFTPRIFTPEQIQDRSDCLKSKSDKTAYLVDRLYREMKLTREHALQLDQMQVLAVTKGQPFVRCGQGANARSYTNAADHWKLFSEVLEFMTDRNRPILCWGDMSIQDGIDKYAVRMSYVSRVLFPRKPGKDGVSKGNA